MAIVPNVSVIIPTYNRSHILTRAIESVLNQTQKAAEIIIIDDNSSDNTQEVLQKYKNNPSIRIIKHSVNFGAQAARNSGIINSSYSWVAFLDSDDYWLPHSLEVRLNNALKFNTNVVYSPCRWIKKDLIEETLIIPKLNGYCFKELLAQPGPMFQSLLVKKQALLDIGLLDEKIVSFQEWDTSIRLSKKNNFSFVDNETFIYDRSGNDNISGDFTNDLIGLYQITMKHRHNIYKYCGAKVLDEKYTKLGYEFLNYNKIWHARKMFFLSFMLNPNNYLNIKNIIKHLVSQFFINRLTRINC